MKAEQASGVKKKKNFILYLSSLELALLPDTCLVLICIFSPLQWCFKVDKITHLFLRVLFLQVTLLVHIYSSLFFVGKSCTAVNRTRPDSHYH